MAKVLITESYLDAIADAVREKLGVETTYMPSQIASAVESITGVTSDDNGKVVVNGELASQTSKSVSANGTYDTTTNNQVVVSVSSNAKIYNFENDDYVMDSTGLICTLGGRSFSKVNSGHAYIAWYYSGSNCGPIIVSETESAVVYTTSNDSKTFSANGSLTYEGKTFYYGGNDYRLGNSSTTNTDGPALKLSGTPSTVAAAAQALLELAYEGNTIDENGTYNVPTGYDGWGDFEVDVPSANLITKTIRANGTYEAEDDNADGYSVVTVNVSGGGSGSTNQTKPIVLILDNENNASTKMGAAYLFENVQPTWTYVFLYSDNQTTNITIGETQHASGDYTIGTSFHGDNVMAFTDETDDFSIALNAGDKGNHVCTLMAISATFETKYTQTMFKTNTATQTIVTALSEAYVLLVFCIYNGGSTASITLNNESITVDRYANRYSNSIYCYVTKLTNLAANDTVSVTVSATASEVIGIMGIFGDME